MEVINFFDSTCKEALLEKIDHADWGAAHFLTQLIREERFYHMLGGEGSLFLLMDGENIVSFATLTRQDSIRDESLFPWIGFVYTYPQYRGNHFSGTLLARIEKIAAAQGVSRVYLSTDHIGLYEKYGYTYLENRLDFWGEDSRVLYKDL